jgi:hypothetical protein
MKTQRVIHLRAALAFGLLAIVSAGVRAQSYGVEDQTLTLGAADFQAESGDEGYLNEYGYLYNLSGSNAYFVVPFALPEGALVEKVCLFARTATPAGGTQVSASLDARKLVPGGGGIGGSTISGSVVTVPASVGYASQCSDTFSYTFQSVIDVDGDGIPDAAMYRARVAVPSWPVPSVGFGGVQITWHRQVSPPPATPTFADVPASDLAWPYVEALAASGITAGCGNGNYCPDATLTRRQMAVFLSKALGLHWPN